MLYNEYRPMQFSAVEGQSENVEILRRQVMNDKTGHAYMFYGHHGCGKTTVARILKLAVNCENPKDGEPCLECSTCKVLLEDSCPDCIEMDAASNNGVDTVRDVTQSVQFSTMLCKKRVIIFDEAHMMTIQGFNALLKVLEEPPENVIFIFCTTDVHKIPKTISSRCQKFNFAALTITQIADYLSRVCESENISFSRDILLMIAKAGNGALRDAMSLLELCASHQDASEDVIRNILGVPSDDIVRELVKSALLKDSVKTIRLLAEADKRGYSAACLKSGVVELLTDMIMLKVEPSLEYESSYRNFIGGIDVDVESANYLLSQLVSEKDFRITLLRSVATNSEMETLRKEVASLKQTIASGVVVSTGVVCEPNAKKETEEQTIPADTESSSMCKQSEEEAIAENEDKAISSSVSVPEAPVSDADLGFGDTELPAGGFVPFMGDSPFSPDEDVDDEDDSEPSDGGEVKDAEPENADDEDDLFDGFDLPYSMG